MSGAGASASPADHRSPPVSEALAARAAKIAARQKIRGCDAVYVALAEQPEMELVTLDRQQLERGVEVVATRSP
jgi:predicted nucleic acid-binding protein